MPDRAFGTAAVPTSAPLAIVLAAGKGTRMRSELPKVLFPACGRPMVRWVIDALKAAGVERIVAVVGYRSDLLRTELAGERGVEFAEQTEQLGTGHAVMMCREQLADHRGPVVVVTGDSPMLRPNSVKAIRAELAERKAACVIGTVRRENPSGYGRIVRNDAGDFVGIVEEKDATPEQQAIREVNVSTYAFDSAELLGSLERLRADNSQREYYITDCPGILLAAGKAVVALEVLEPCEALSVNSVEELAVVEAEMRRMGMAS